MVLTDTFAESNVDALLVDDELNRNNQLSAGVRALPFKVIIGNPPYSYRLQASGFWAAWLCWAPL